LVNLILETGAILALLSLALSSLSLLYSYFRNRTGDIKELENRLTRLEGNQFTDIDRDRLTKLEQNQFTPQDKKCLRELDVKVGVFWSIIEREAPRLLRQHLTPSLDALLAKAEKGISKLSKKEQMELKKLVDEQYDATVNSGDLEDPGRALVLALYKGVLEVETNSKEGC
jgi:hypothetical protein